LPFEIIFRECNETHENASEEFIQMVDIYLPRLFQPNLICAGAGYNNSEKGPCKGDSGGPLMIFDTSI